MTLGLRGQLIVALSIVFAISFALLSAAALQLTRRDAQLAEQRVARQWAQLLAVDYRNRATADLLEALSKLHQEGLIAAAAFRHDKRVDAIGHPPSRAGMQVQMNQGELTLWAQRSYSTNASPMQRLLLSYVGLTGLSVLLLAYILLTVTLIRPLENATRAAETMAMGNLDIRVPLRGATEVVRLARGYNRMADELRKQQVELQARVRELEAATTALKASQAQVVHAEKLASVGRLSAGIAHEIGNPLSAMLGLLELLQDGDLSQQEQREFVARIQKETERIHHIIGGLLTYARKDGNEDLPSQPVDLQAVIDDVLSLLGQKTKAHGIEVEVTLTDSARWVMGGSAQLLQIILNIIQNAVQAAPHGGHVWITAREEDDAVTLTIEDDGPGIAESMLDQLFEPFATTKPPGEGTGLGLAVCHALVEHMGGQLRAENRSQSGARFSMTLRKASGDSVGS